MTYLVKDTVTATDFELIAFAREEINRFGSGFFRGFELLVVKQQLNELSPTMRLSGYVIEQSVDFQRLSCPLNPFPVPINPQSALDMNLNVSAMLRSPPRCFQISRL